MNSRSTIEWTAAHAAPTAVYAAARSRAVGPTADMWHAVGLHRSSCEMDGATELTACGVLARVIVGQSWPPTARDLCPGCVSLTC